ncbi:smr (Small MutS Related) domain-containing protein [Quillaja saponaria]|nr:smr (Small MutS Related) domain-containing protein [Quillaja saponaria]
MSVPKGKSPGWAAFDLKQRQKQGLGHETKKDLFPPISSSLTTLRPSEKLLRNTDDSVRSFSSVLLPSNDLPAFRENWDCKKPNVVGDSTGKYKASIGGENDNVLAIRKLKEQHSWADNSLIQDILVAVDNNYNEASTLLKRMISPVNIEKDELCTGGPSKTSGNIPCDEKTNKSLSLGKCMDLTQVTHTPDVCLRENDKGLVDENNSSDKKIFDAGNMRLIMGHLNSVPVEPEWEENDDVYIIHRKDALRMMRSASQHSRAATNAFLRGDHFSAQQHSLKAREEWFAAERLNAKAAKEILSIRNDKNNLWILDLHGLHAAEAVQALQERLQGIERQGFSNKSLSPNRLEENDEIPSSSSVESFSCMDTEKMDKQHAQSKLSPSSLQVITGVGNHSRGQAALPIAVRSFLNENGYRFDEFRPGVITVWPKFRIVFG